MHRKAVFTIAAVFLVIALTIPPAIVILQTNNTIYKYIIPFITPTQGSTNVTITVTPQQRDSFNNAFIIAAIIEVIFIVLFAVTLYFGINHPHPSHKGLEPKRTNTIKANYIPNQRYILLNNAKRN
jgi:uncharacterized membrane protein YtjA (UPF0391 family)